MTHPPPDLPPEPDVRGRAMPPGELPFLDCEGTSHECGLMLGCAWREVLHVTAQRHAAATPWWKDPDLSPYLSRHAPHLPDLYRGMAQGAGLDGTQVGPRADPGPGGCTSFAVAPEATLDGSPISGQTKDVSYRRGLQLLVLRLRLSDGPSTLTLTYPGWLYGHGFVKGGTAVFRNSLYVAPRHNGIEYDVWGMLALHSPDVEAVKAMTRELGCPQPFHATVADEHGGVLGIENGRGGPRFLKPRRGVYTHANCVLSGQAMRRFETEDRGFSVSDSLHRGRRLRDRLEADRGRLTSQLAYAALCDHSNYPTAICRHQSQQAWTAAAVIVEPVKGLLHVTRGAPCQNWPRSYALGK